MNFETLTQKQLGEVEHLAHSLLEALRAGQFSQEAVYGELMLLQEAAQKERQLRLDQSDQPQKSQ